MSQTSECDKNLASYFSAKKSFEYVESLYNSEVANFEHVQEELHKCYQKIETLVFEETDSPYWIDLLQLKELVLDLFKIVEEKMSKQAVPKLPTRVQQKESPTDRALNMIKSTIEMPRVSSLKEVAGLWEIKKLLKSLVILPQKQPQLFYNLKACNSVLLFGPPGTGKTRLVHALASEANAVLYSASVSAMLSPLVGQTEKNVQALFEHVRNGDNFSILFIDEVDGLCRTRHDSEQDHSRRMKTELMCQMSKIEDERNLFLIGATNCPWDLDRAFLRRFQKRLYVPLPNSAERHELFQLFAKNTSLEVNGEYWDLLVEKTEGFSGSDLSNVVQSALNAPITELEDTKIWKLTEDGCYEPVVTAEDFNLEDIMCCELEDLPFGSVRARPAQMLDLLNCLSGIGPTVSTANMKMYESFIGK